MSAFTARQRDEFAAGIDRLLADDAPLVTFTGQVHPYADRWPMRPADEIEEMAESIRANGQRFPILLTADGVLVDGRNRLRACELAGVEPRFEVRQELANEDAITAFIWDANGDRRNLSKGQRAMLAALRPGAQRALSAQTGVADGYVNKARQVIQWCDADVVEAVIDGTLALNDAYAAAQEIKATEQAEEIARKKAEKEAAEKARRDTALLADLREHRPDLAALVDETRLSLDDALRLRRDDLAKEAAREKAKAAADRQFVADIHAAFAAISMLEQEQHWQRLIDNWRPGPGPITAETFQETAAILTARAEQWTHA